MTSVQTQPPISIDADLAARITAVTLDVDGVMTDGRITYTSAGDEIKAFHVQDGSAIKLLQRNDIAVAIITGRRSPMVERRAEELGITHLYQGREEKLAALQDFATRTDKAPEAIMHIGDDLADFALKPHVGCFATVADGHPHVRAHADLVTTRRGGEGAVSEIVYALLTAKALWNF